MKTIELKLYEYAELSKEAKAKALQHHAENADDPFMQSHMINLLGEVLDEHDIKYGYPRKDLDVRYSLSHSQGDGFMFEGELEWNEYTVYIKHSRDAFYYHKRTADIEIQKSDKLGEHIDDEDEILDKFNKLYYSICDIMERKGYEYISYLESEEYFEQECENNEYMFTEDGTRYSV